MIGAQPLFDRVQRLRIALQIRGWNLVRAIGALDLQTLVRLNAGPTLGRAKNQHWPGWLRNGVSAACRLLDVANFVIDLIYLLSQQRVSPGGLDDMHAIAVSTEQLSQFCVAHCTIDGWIANFVAIEM